MEAISQAITKLEGEKAKAVFLAQDYSMLKNAQPTDKKGKPNQTLISKYQKQAQKLYEAVVYNQTVKEKVHISEKQQQEAFEFLKQTLGF